MSFTPGIPTPSTSSFNYSATAPFQRQFVSAQRRYDNLRVRENEMQYRLCRECGRIVHGDDHNFQHHVVSHEAAFICYQIYHYEKGTTLPKNYHGHSRAKFTKDKSVTGSSPKKSARDLVRKQLKQSEPRKRKSESQPRPPKPPKQSKSLKVRDSRFINDQTVVKSELNLSEDESDVSHVTDSDSADDVLLPVDDDYEDKVIALQDPDGADYVPVKSTSLRGRERKPKNVVDE